MNLQTAQIDELIEYLLVNPSPTGEEAGEILLNLCQRLACLEGQNVKQDTAIDGNRHGLVDLMKRRRKGQIYAARRRATSYPREPRKD